MPCRAAFTYYIEQLIDTSGVLREESARSGHIAVLRHNSVIPIYGALFGPWDNGTCWSIRTTNVFINP